MIHSIQSNKYSGHLKVEVYQCFNISNYSTVMKIIQKIIICKLKNLQIPFLSSNEQNQIKRKFPFLFQSLQTLTISNHGENIVTFFPFSFFFILFSGLNSDAKKEKNNVLLFLLFFHMRYDYKTIKFFFLNPIICNQISHTHIPNIYLNEIWIW